MGSPGGDESAVDDEVGAGEVAGVVAGQQHDKVGHLFGVSETPRHRVCGGLFGDIPGFAAACAGHRRGDAVLAEPQRGGDRSRTDGVDADASRANVLGERLREVQKGDLAAL